MKSEILIMKDDAAASNVVAFCCREKSFWLMNLLVGDIVAVKWRDHTTEEYHPESNLKAYFAERRRRYVQDLKLACVELTRGKLLNAAACIHDCLVFQSKTLLTTIPMLGACTSDGSEINLHYIEAGKHVLFTDFTISGQPIREFTVYRDNKKISHICLRTTDTMS